MTKLTFEAVETLFADCLREKDAPLITGIINKAHLDVAGHEAEIAALLDELPEPFQLAIGGGWSFLNACDDKHGNQWTGLHQTMEFLFMLGMAAGMVRFALPRSMWQALPGGMPYIVVNTEGFSDAGQPVPPGSN